MDQFILYISTLPLSLSLTHKKIESNRQNNQHSCWVGRQAAAEKHGKHNNPDNGNYAKQLKNHERLVQDNIL
ncbi:Uncharacterised protein [Yersinia pseudotuberculosis]|uniref:hypothetical protein n=1 Tax=Yersinia pseudotuberculosis TaxID=633 RepID=UPI0004F5BD7B|nr:hypothetical protein [Yersinia pseudotuberculosis]AIN15618.1 hypothetical protein DJ40_1698 [Yersinia pseudotuberculosis]AJJ07698.1 hypothetical protein BZ20_1424 [Yersinia pseudotuberculosis]MBO1554105.1 hypothetical protein [Yersinia pseudotuberculosis]MBO1560668.1 hypothetical protein [Yersinia pseudotuberculosis]CNJ50585.1 Uncharacterised protein [Yersinia pseudotuberculosis]